MTHTHARIVHTPVIAVFAAALAVTPAFAQTSGSGAGGGSAGASPSAAPLSPPVSGTGPTPAPTPNQSTTFPSISGTPGTGPTDNRVPSGIAPSAPIIAQPVPPSLSEQAPPAGTQSSTVRPGCGPAATTGSTTELGGVTVGSGAPVIMQDPASGFGMSGSTLPRSSTPRC